MIYSSKNFSLNILPKFTLFIMQYFHMAVYGRVGRISHKHPVCLEAVHDNVNDYTPTRVYATSRRCVDRF